MELHSILLPEPQQVLPRAGSFALQEDGQIWLDHSGIESLQGSARRLQEAIESRLGFSWGISAESVMREEIPSVKIRLLPEIAPRPQSYGLVIGMQGIEIFAHDPAGAFYAVCTLIQLIQFHGRNLPAMEIIDWPDYPTRGVMLDISRDKVYSMDTLFALIDRLAGWKINQLQLYTEHTFQYQNHSEVWQKASPMTPQEIRLLDQFCKERMIELVPNQNSFGHMERWLVHERYAHLAETHDWFKTPWGPQKGPFSLLPSNPESLELIFGLYDELLLNFTSRMLNVGCDETFDVGQGKTQARVESEGLGRVYLDHLLKVYEDVSRRGRVMQFWGDIITTQPELVSELPRDVIALLWGYEADHPFSSESAQFAAAGIPFYVCPGTSSWTSLAGRTENCLENIRNAAVNGLKHGAIGLLTTDWGDLGHWQQLPFSYLGLASGAALSWAFGSNVNAKIAEQVSRYAFEDATGSMGQLAFDLGNVYRATGAQIHNGSVLFWILQLPLQELKPYMDLGVTAEHLNSTLQAIDWAMSGLDREQMQRLDADLIRREFELTARLMRHACRRGLLLFGEDSPAIRRSLEEDLQEILVEYRQIWLERNRPGGLEDSLARFYPMLVEYRV